MDEEQGPWTATEATAATKAQIDQYIKNSINIYISDRLIGSELFGFWQADFAGFDANVYKKTTTLTKTLRDFLRSKNVYIPKNRLAIGVQLVASAAEAWQPMPEDQRVEVRIETTTTGQGATTSTQSSNYNPLVTLSRLYTEEQKYGGDPDDSFDLKWQIFRDLCNIAKVPDDQVMNGVRMMLKDTALVQYYVLFPVGSVLSTLGDMKNKIRNLFEGHEHKEAMLAKWNSLSLQKICAEENDLEKALQKLITDLRSIQAKLEPDLRTGAFMKAKLLTACREHPGCQIACSTRSATVTELIDALRSNVTTWKAQQLSTQSTQFVSEETWFTDRRFHARPPFQRNNSSWGTPSISSRGSSLNNDATRSSSSRPKTCFVCRRESCWSTKHTTEERQQAKDRFRTAYRKSSENNAPRKYLAEADLDTHLEHYILDFEGQDEDAELSQMIEEFETFMTQDVSSEQESFLTICGPIKQEEAIKLTQNLQQISAAHGLTRECFYTTDRYSDKIFHGILVDTGAAGHSTAGAHQLKAFESIFGTQKINCRDQVTVKFGMGITTSIGSVEIDTPIGNCVFHVVNTSIPFLLSLDDMDRKKAFLDNVENYVVQGSKRLPVVRRFGHAFLQWGAMDSYLTEVELRTLHRRFGHPSARKLTRLLERAGHQDPQHREFLQKITKLCQQCQKNASPPMRFKFALRDENIAFNHSIYVDIMYIDGKPVLHVVDEATRYQATRWLANMSSETVWEALRCCWMDCYLGPPDIVIHDAGTNFTSAEFNQYAASLGMILKEVPVEAPQSMGIVERYHQPIRRAYKIIADETKITNKAVVLQMATKCVNDTAGPDGLVPTLLVFGAYPRMCVQDRAPTTIMQRVKAIEKAMIEVSKLRALRQVNEALKTRNGPTQETLEIGCQVLVWRTHRKEWDGPFKLLNRDAETVTVELPSGPTQFRSTSVKKFHLEQSNGAANDDSEDGNIITRSTHSERAERLQRDRCLPKRFREPEIEILLTEPPTPNFTASRERELTGLLQRGVFQYERLESVPASTRIFNSRFVDLIKLAGTPRAFEKSRLVVQAYNDSGKRMILTQAPTIQRASQRLLIAIAVMRNLEIYTRDISQAYVQSKSSLTRDVFVKPPPELKLPEGLILRVIKPLYGIPEAGNHWFHTYHRHHIDKLHLRESASDACLLFGKRVIVALQTDDTLFACNDDYKQAEETELQKAGFDAKETEQLTINHPITFNGAELSRNANGTITVSQRTQCRKIQLVDVTAADPRAEYVAQRARGAYVASTCQPEAAFSLSKAAQTTNPTKGDIERLNKCLAWQIGGKGLKFVKLNEPTLRLVTFADGSFAGNEDHSSQIGYVIVLADDIGNCNILHWSSVKCRRITRSVLAAELYGFATAFDAACVLKNTIDSILGINVPLIMATDSYSLYECLVKLGTTREKRLMIDISAIRQSYERREITEVVWIDGRSNPADSMTKSACNGALKTMVDLNKLAMEKVAWVERTIPTICDP